MRCACSVQDFQQRGQSRTINSTQAYVPWTLLTCKSSLLCFKPVLRHQSSDAPVFATTLYWRCFKLSHYLIKAPCATIPSAHGKQPVLLELLPVTRRKGLSCGLASIAVVLGGLLCSFVEGGKLERLEFLKEVIFFFFFNLENSSWNQKAAPILLCCRNCCVKIKSGLIVVELDLRRLSIRSELKAGKEHQAARQIFQAFPPLPPVSFGLY